MMDYMNFDNLCGVCGLSFPSDCLISVSEKTNTKLHSIIKLHLPSQKYNKIFPLNICNKCKNHLSSWHLIYQTCEKTFKKISTTNLLNLPVIQNKKIQNIQNNSTTSKILETDQNEIDCRIYINEPNSKFLIQCPEYAKKPEVYRCYYCDIKHFQTKNLLNNHLKNDHSDIIFLCEICKEYCPRLELMSHMTKHAQKIYSTDQSAAVPCTDYNEKQIGSTEHEQKTRISKNKIRCSKCAKFFASMADKKKHVQIFHLKQKNFKCLECNAEFSDKRVLSNHVISIHSKLKDLKCDICDKNFKTDSTLYTHKKTHSVEKPFSCELCKDKKFKLKQYLIAHMSQHKNNKEFICNVCNKYFFSKNNLTKHSKIHLITEIFTCHICGLRLKQKRYLKEHLKKLHMK